MASHLLPKIVGFFRGRKCINVPFNLTELKDNGNMRQIIGDSKQQKISEELLKNTIEREKSRR